MAKLTLLDITNLNNEQAVTTAINQNSAAIEAAMEITLSRDGTQPNQMDATLDMDSNRIINLPKAITNFEPVRKIDLDEATFGPPTNGGTAGVSSIDGVLGALTTGQTLEMVGQDLRTVAFTGDVGAPANTFATTIAPGVVTNAKMAPMNGRSFKGNISTLPLTPQDIAIIDLNPNVVVHPDNDWMLCHKGTTNSFQKVNTTQLGAAGAWVTSVEGVKGAVNLTQGAGISIAADIANKTITISNTGGGANSGSVESIGGVQGTVLLAPGLERVSSTSQTIRIDDVWMKRPTNFNWFIGDAGNPLPTTVDGPNSGQNNIGIGNAALGVLTTGLLNICIGSQSGQGITKGDSNIAIGVQALDVARASGAGLFVLTLNTPLQDQTVSIGNTTYRRTYRFRTSLLADGDVLIGSSAVATLTNLRDAINKAAVSGTYIAATAHPLVSAGATIGVVNNPDPIPDGASMSIATKDPDGAGELDAFESAWSLERLETTCLEEVAHWTRPTIFGAGHAGSNIAIGHSSLAKAVTSTNVVIGHSAGANIYGSNNDSNVIIGSAAGFALGEGIGNNTIIGYQAGYGFDQNPPTDMRTATYAYCTGIGTFALQWCGWGAFNQTGLYPLENTAVGATAGLSITTGDSNTAIGANALGGNFEPSLDANTGRLPITGSLNTAVGDSALRWVSSCGRNTAVGFRSQFSRAPETSTYTPPPIANDTPRGQIFHLTGFDNVSVGYNTLHTIVRSAARNVAIGSAAIGLGTKTYVPANEATFPYSEWLKDNFEGSGNIAIGSFAGYALRNKFGPRPPPADQSVIVNLGPHKNIFIGDYATSTEALKLGIVTGSNNVIIGGEIINLGDVDNNVILATGDGATRILWWDETHLKLPCLTGEGLLALDGNNNVIVGAVGVPGGGTGIASYDQGDMIYAQADDMLVTLTKSVIATEYLSNTGTANAPKWAKIDLATGVTGQLPVAGIAATGTANATTFLRGDGTWAPGGGGGGVIGPGLTTAGRMATYADTSGNILSAALVGSATQVLHGGTNGVVGFSAVNLATDVSGNLSINNLASGSGANSTTFWRGDGQWAAPPGGTGTGGVSGPGTTTVGRIATYGTVDGNTLEDNIIGSATQVLHGGTDGAVSFSSVNLATDVSGQLPLGFIAGGAGGDGTKFLAGDNTWKTVTSGGSGAVNPDGSTIDGGIAVFKNTAGTLIGDLAIGPLGTSTTVLHGNAAGEPFYAGVDLTVDTVGVLPTSKGGLGAALVGTPGGLAYFNSGTSITSSGALLTNGILLGGGSGNPPSALTTSILGNILIAQGSGQAPSWQTLKGAIAMTGSTGTIVMNSGQTYPEARFTGSMALQNPFENVFIMQHIPAAGAPSDDGTIIGRIRFDAIADIVPDPNVSRVYGAIWCQMLENTNNVSRIFFDVSQGGTTTKTGMVLGGSSTSVDLQVPNGDVKVTLAGKGFTTSTTGFATVGSGGITSGGKLISTGGASTDGVGYGAGAGSSVTQLTSNLTSVGVGAAQCGVITTINSDPFTLAAGASSSFPVAVTGLNATDTIIVNHQLYSGTGTPVVAAGNIQANSFRIYIRNIHATAAMNDNLVINWAIIKSTSAGTLLARIADRMDGPQVDPQ